MSRETHEVIGPNHIHRGRPLAVGEAVEIHPQVADRYPQIFKRKPAKAEPAARVPAAANNGE